MKHQRISHFLAAFLLSAGGFAVVVGGWYILRPNPKPAPIPIHTFTAADVIEIVNLQREGEGLNALHIDNSLTKAAELKALDMDKRDYFAHHLGDEDTFQFLDIAGYKYISAGENLAICFNDTKELIQAWMLSPGHRTNITRASWEDTGVAVLDTHIHGESCLLVVQEFGKPNPHPLDREPLQ